MKFTSIITRLGLLVCFATTSLGLISCASLKMSKEHPISEIPRNVPEEGYQPSEQYGHVSIDQNKNVDQWLKYFTGRGRKYMHVYLERSARYIPMMKATFRERGMPDELAYVAMIESGFSPTAYSHASAVGYWQFIRETGKRYNLRIDQFVDERRDPILSTQAAANYLDSLYSLFGDWHLSLCAYNAGERRIQKAVMKYRTRNFWELSNHRRALPRETDNYIPKYIAAVMIARDPAKYGFMDIDFQPAFSFETIVVEKPVSLELLANELSMDFAELKKMNPRYKSDYVPVYADRVNALRVPVGKKDLAIAALPKINSDKPRIFVAEFDYYRIKRGDTLSHIARRYRTSIAKLRDLNDLSRRSLLRIGQKIKVPDNSGGVVQSEASLKKSPPKVSRRIASSKSRSPSKSSITQRTARNDSKVHVVRRGENLSVIAKKYRITVKDIAQANSLRNRSKIFVGAELLIPN